MMGRKGASPRTCRWNRDHHRHREAIASTRNARAAGRSACRHLWSATVFTGNFHQFLFISGGRKGLPTRTHLGHHALQLVLRVPLHAPAAAVERVRHASAGRTVPAELVDDEGEALPGLEAKRIGIEVEEQGT